MLRPLHPDVEISDPERVGAGPFRGHGEYLQVLADWMEIWEEYEVQMEGPVVVGDTVVALVRHGPRTRQRGRGDQQGANLFRVQDGLIVFFRPYTDRSEALEAAGLKGSGHVAGSIETLAPARRVEPA